MCVLLCPVTVAGLPSARLISIQAISTANTTPDSEYTCLLMQWGQFHDHDITLTPTVVVTADLNNGVSCEETCENVSPCFPIEIPPNDPRIKYKYRVVFRGNDVRDQNFDVALFQDMGSSASTMTKILQKPVLNM